MDFLSLIENSFTSFGYSLIFFAAFLESIILLGFILPGGLFVLLGGFYAQQNKLSIIWVILLSWLGMFLGDLLNYWLGKTGFHKLFIKYFKLDHFLKNYKLANIHIKKYGISAIIYSHIVGYLRSFICFSAGCVAFPFKTYIITVSVASLIWSLIFVTIGFVFGEKTSDLLSVSHKFTVIAWWVLILFIIISFLQKILFRVFFKLKKS